MTFCKQDYDSFMGNAMTALSLILVAARLPCCKDTSTTFSNNTVSIHQKEEKKNIFVSLSKPQDLKMWLDVCLLPPDVLCLVFLASAHKRNRIHREDSVISSEWTERKMVSRGNLQFDVCCKAPTEYLIFFTVSGRGQDFCF